VRFGGNAAWSPLTLFAAGEQGGWYDPSDLTTMFQDSAGTTPVTAVEQPVGRLLDKSGRGNHLIQPTSASRPTYSKRYNVLPNSEAFQNWITNANITRTPNAAVSPSGRTTATLCVPSATLDGKLVYEVSFATTSAGNWQYSVCIKPNGYSWVAVAFNGGAAWSGTYANVSTGVLGSTYIGAPISKSITDMGDGWYKVTITGAATSAITQVRVLITDADNGGSISGNGSGVYLTEGDFRRTIHTTMGMPAYQRATTATDYDETGFLPRLRFDGADDSMYSAAAVNFTASDEMTVLAGLTKLSDATSGTVCELSAAVDANNGSFRLRAPNTNATGDLGLISPVGLTTVT
jgi:hypothetical protein